MSWFLVAFLAYFLLAIANLVDKFLVEKVVASARAYTFITSLMGALVLLASPWLLRWPGLGGFSLNIVLGFTFFFALLFLYSALREGEASQILVIIGGSTPLFSLPLSVLVLGDNFNPAHLKAIFLFILGLLSIALLPQKKEDVWSKFFRFFNIKKKRRFKGISLALASGLFYALFFVGSKFAYQSQESFTSVFIWSRLGALIIALSLLFSTKARIEIKKFFSKNKKKKGKDNNKFLVLSNQVLGASGFILQNYAIFLGPVALVNALQGVQYAWIIVLGILLSIFYPKILKEDFSKRIIAQKIIAIIFISIGVYLLAI